MCAKESQLASIKWLSASCNAPLVAKMLQVASCVFSYRKSGRKGRGVCCMVTLKCRPSVQQQRQRQPHRHHQLNEMIEAELKSLVSLQHARQQLASSPSPTDKLSMAGIGKGREGEERRKGLVWSLWSRSLITTCCKFLWKPLHDLHAQIAHTPH